MQKEDKKNLVIECKAKDLTTNILALANEMKAIGVTTLGEYKEYLKTIN